MENEYPEKGEDLGGASVIRETGKVGKRGTVVIAASLRRRFGLDDGSLIIEEETPEGVLIRPAVAMPLEIYSRERRAEFILNNAVEADDYRRARKEVEKLGLDPDEIPHRRPSGA
jgi:bifunctional DNA-binding transcriptional regulator/antitoxin component of YhaV-PrlF toxin-antitoxin module